MVSEMLQEGYVEEQLIRDLDPSLLKEGEKSSIIFCIQDHILLLYVLSGDERKERHQKQSPPESNVMQEKGILKTSRSLMSPFDFEVWNN